MKTIYSSCPPHSFTPKVCRKSSPDSPPSVKALVKKFQLDAAAAAAAAAAAVANHKNCISDDQCDGGVDGSADTDNSCTTKLVDVDYTAAAAAATRCCSSIQHQQQPAPPPPSTCCTTTTTTTNGGGRKSQITVGGLLDAGIIC